MADTVSSMSPLAHAVARFYSGLWLCVCAGALVVAVRRRGEVLLFSGAYVRGLLVPWKLATFVVAWGSLLVLAPHAHDPSWDRVDATFMSWLTFGTAPWVVATLRAYRRGEADRGMAALAVCLMLFSASWSYDLYLYVRDGIYPKTWLGNLIVGPLLYLAGGTFWSLDLRGGRRRVVIALALMGFATACFLPYLWPSLRGIPPVR